MINFLFTINDSYIEPILTLIFTIEHNNRNEDKCYYFIYKNISEKNQTIIQEYVSNFDSHVKFVPFKINENIEFGSSGTWTEETYFRIFAPYLLNNLDKVIYLDGDTIVDSNIGHLFNKIDMSEFALAAVPNDIEETNIKRLGLPLGSRYFNAGVLFMNLEMMRKMYSEIQTISLLKKLKSILTFRDQDYLNIAFNKNILSLPREFNYMINVTERNKSYKKIKKYYICHYVLSKPWENEFKYKTDKKYLYYLARSGNIKKALILLYRHRKFRLWCLIKGKIE